MSGHSINPFVVKDGEKKVSLSKALRAQIEALRLAKFEAIPSEGLVLVTLDSTGMSRGNLSQVCASLADVLTGLKKDGKTTASFIVTATNTHDQLNFEALPDDKLASIGLVRACVMQSERQELATNLEKVIAEKVAQRDELLSALEQLFEIGEVYSSAIERDEHNAAGNKKDFREWEVIALAAIAKARGDV